jgi:hypothetical protein
VQPEAWRKVEETLTVHRLQLPPQLRQTLASTNVIESASQWSNEFARM